MKDKDIEELEQEANEKLYEYIDLLEKANDELLIALKKCVSLLSQFSEAIPGMEGFEDALGQLKEIVMIGERVVIKETLH